MKKFKLNFLFIYFQFDANAVQNLLLKYANKPGVRKQNMKIMYDIVKEYVFSVYYIIM